MYPTPTSATRMGPRLDGSVIRPPSTAFAARCGTPASMLAAAGPEPIAASGGVRASPARSIAVGALGRGVCLLVFAQFRLCHTPAAHGSTDTRNVRDRDPWAVQ